MSDKYNICAVVQSGRLGYEAILFLASFRACNPDFGGRVLLLEPSGRLWPEPVGLPDDVRTLLQDMGAEFLSFENAIWGARYPNGNKIEALSVLPDEPFVFFDTDTVFTGNIASVPFDFNRPTASMRREDTWPKEHLYGPTRHQIWASVYEKFGLDFESSQDQDISLNTWKRYLYFNAGWFFYRSPHEFGHLFQKYAKEIEETPPKPLETQAFYPWLDQIALPLVVHKLNGGRNTVPEGFLDGSVTCHYRFLPLLYAREPEETIALVRQVTAPNKIKKVLKQYRPFQQLIYQNKGQKVRDLFDRSALPRREQGIRKRIKDAKLWMR